MSLALPELFSNAKAHARGTVPSGATAISLKGKTLIIFDFLILVKAFRHCTRGTSTAGAGVGPDNVLFISYMGDYTIVFASYYEECYLYQEYHLHSADPNRQPEKASHRQAAQHALDQ